MTMENKMAFKKVRLLGPDISLQGLDIVAFQNQRDAIAKNLHEVGDWAARPFREVAGALVADYSTRSYKTIERSLLTGESPEAQFVHDLLGDLRVDAQPFADQLKIYARDPSQLAIDLSPVIRDGTGKLQWNKRGARNFGLLTVLVATAGYGAACAASVLKNGGGGGGGVTPTINKDNCPSLT
jgi:hypothetical protein